MPAVRPAGAEGEPASVIGEGELRRAIEEADALDAEHADARAGSLDVCGVDSEAAWRLAERAAIASGDCEDDRDVEIVASVWFDAFRVGVRARRPTPAAAATIRDDSDSGALDWHGAFEAWALRNGVDLEAVSDVAERRVALFVDAAQMSDEDLGFLDGVWTAGLVAGVRLAGWIGEGPGG